MEHNKSNNNKESFMDNSQIEVINYLNTYIQTAPSTMYIEEYGRVVTLDKLMNFLSVHCAEDKEFDNFSIIQAVFPELISSLLGSALSNLSRIWGDTSEGESFFEQSMMATAEDTIKVLFRFDIAWVDRAIMAELTHGKPTRWRFVESEHKALLGMFEQRDAEMEALRQKWQQQAINNIHNN